MAGTFANAVRNSGKAVIATAIVLSPVTIPAAAHVAGAEKTAEAKEERAKIAGVITAITIGGPTIFGTGLAYKAGKEVATNVENWLENTTTYKALSREARTERV